MNTYISMGQDIFMQHMYVSNKSTQSTHTHMRAYVTKCARAAYNAMLAIAYMSVCVCVWLINF